MRRGLPAAACSVRQSRVMAMAMVSEDAHWCGGPEAWSLLGPVSSRGDLFWFCGLRAAGCGFAFWAHQALLLCLATPTPGESTGWTGWTGCSRAASRQLERPRGEIGCVGLRRAAGGVRICVLRRLVGWMWPPGDFVQAWQASVVSSHNRFFSRPQDRLEEMEPLTRLLARTATQQPPFS